MKRWVFVILHEHVGTQITVVEEWWEENEDITLGMNTPVKILSCKRKDSEVKEVTRYRHRTWDHKVELSCQDVSKSICWEGWISKERACKQMREGGIIDGREFPGSQMEWLDCRWKASLFSGHKKFQASADRATCKIGGMIWDNSDLDIRKWETRWSNERRVKGWWSSDLEKSSGHLGSWLKAIGAEANNVLSKDHPSNHHNTVGTHSELSLPTLSLLMDQGPFLALPLSLATFSLTFHQEADSDDFYRLPLHGEGIDLFLVPMTLVQLFMQQLKPMLSTCQKMLLFLRPHRVFECLAI